jgi:hypothetical protein
VNTCIKTKTSPIIISNREIAVKDRGRFNYC